MEPRGELRGTTFIKREIASMGLAEELRRLPDFSQRPSMQSHRSRRIFTNVVNPEARIE